MDVLALVLDRRRHSDNLVKLLLLPVEKRGLLSFQCFCRLQEESFAVSRYATLPTLEVT